MKTSLDHLPEKKQHQVRALGELIRKEAEVEMVILFGSFDPKFAITSEELAAIAVHVRELRSRVEMVCRERIEAMAVEMPG